MPPNYDIYVIVKRRDKNILDTFITSYVDRDASEDRGDEELMILPADATSNDLEFRKWHWEPAKSLIHSLTRGLVKPYRAFAIYLQAKDSELDRAIIAFTKDDGIVFGLSLDDADERPENLGRAEELMHQLIQIVGGYAALVQVELPPPLSREDFLEAQKCEHTLHSWRLSEGAL